MEYVTRAHFLERYEHLEGVGSSLWTENWETGHCMFDKQLTKNTMDYNHSDLWGPSQMQSQGGARCILTFIDDFSQKVCIYFLKHKSKVVVCLSNLYTWQKIRQVRKLRDLELTKGLMSLAKKTKVTGIALSLEHHSKMELKNGWTEFCSRELDICSLLLIVTRFLDKGYEPGMSPNWQISSICQWVSDSRENVDWSTYWLLELLSV